MIDIEQLHLKCRGMLRAIMLICLASQVYADESANTAIDCSTVKVNFIENPEWTDQERLEAMNKAFYESVQRYELCQMSNQSSASSASAKATSKTSNTNNLTGTDSVASPLVTGTETTTKPESVSSVSDDSTLTDKSDNNSVTSMETATPNGKTPEDIPSADNDDVIAAQIRLAAEIEKDPEKKARLWNEYRKYKGLAVK